jgi:hypothetical protein
LNHFDDYVAESKRRRVFLESDHKFFEENLNLAESYAYSYLQLAIENNLIDFANHLCFMLNRKARGICLALAVRNDDDDVAKFLIQKRANLEVATKCIKACHPGKLRKLTDLISEYHVEQELRRLR